jgi:hypothetical protein
MGRGNFVMSIAQSAVGAGVLDWRIIDNNDSNIYLTNQTSRNVELNVAFNHPMHRNVTIYTSNICGQHDQVTFDMFVTQTPVIVNPIVFNTMADGVYTYPMQTLSTNSNLYWFLSTANTPKDLTIDSNTGVLTSKYIVDATLTVSACNVYGDTNSVTFYYNIDQVIPIPKIIDPGYLVANMYPPDVFTYQMSLEETTVAANVTWYLSDPILSNVAIDSASGLLTVTDTCVGSTKVAACNIYNYSGTRMVNLNVTYDLASTTTV